MDNVEKVARIIEPYGWRQFDDALRPYKENRGAQGNTAEQFWYSITYQQHSFRTAKEVRKWFLIEDTDGKEDRWPVCVFAVRDSLKKAESVLSAIDPVALVQAGIDAAYDAVQYCVNGYPLDDIRALSASDVLKEMK